MTGRPALLLDYFIAMTYGRPIGLSSMNTKEILSELQSQRDRLNKAIAALEAIDSGSKARKTRSASAAPRRHRMSAQARKRLSDLMKKRWASGKMKKSKAKVA